MEEYEKILESGEFQVIVVGGWFPGTFYSSVEVLDEETFTWKAGPVLPLGITDGSLVEDPSGGVILVGGRDSSVALNTLYRLAHAVATEWTLMPQRLKVARQYPAAFLIPEGVVDCAMAND